MDDAFVEEIEIPEQPLQEHREKTAERLRRKRLFSGAFAESALQSKVTFVTFQLLIIEGFFVI